MLHEQFGEGIRRANSFFKRWYRFLSAKGLGPPSFEACFLNSAMNLVLDFKSLN